MEENHKEVSKDRVQKLGFKPQKEIIYNTLIPNAQDIDDDSVQMFASIKENLGRAVMMREMRPGCGMWTARLAKFIKLYGLKFSKEDHLILIHLMYELVTIPNLEPWLVSKYGQLLTRLLKKKQLISPKELCLPWRPLYDLCLRIMSTSASTLGIYRYFSSLENTLESLVHAAKCYFPLEATQEMLEEWRAKLCPFDSSSICTTVETLEWFLPVTVPPSESERGHKLWLEELMRLWDACHNAPAWEPDMMWLMARLASSNVGHINWEPYVPIMFARFTRSFSLPVSYKQVPGARQHKLDTSAMALWIVSVLGGGGSAQKYLDTLLRSLESYFHPANMGHWLLRLKKLLRKLPQYFVTRLHNERHKRYTWETQVASSHRLTEDDITAFVESVKPIAMQAMYSKVWTDVGDAMKHLAMLRPALIIPLVVDRMQSTLGAVTEPHKLTAAMQCIVSVALPMVRGPRAGYPEGPTHVVPLLLASLPGIDPNDWWKSYWTFQMVTTFAAMVPIVDASQSIGCWNDLTEAEETACIASAQLEDFVLQFLDRCLVLIESSSLETTHLERDSDQRSSIESLVEGAISSTCTTLIMQTSPAILRSALRKLTAFVTNRILETKVAGRCLAAVCRAFAKASPEDTTRALLPHLCARLRTLLGPDEVLAEERLDHELLYILQLLSGVVSCRGSALLPYIESLEGVLRRALCLESREGYSLASIVLRYLLSSLTEACPFEYCSGVQPFSLEAPPPRQWGQPGCVSNLGLAWYVPGSEEEACVAKLVGEHLPPRLALLDAFVEGRESLTREQLQQTITVICGIFGARLMLPLWDESPVTVCPDSVLQPVSFGPCKGLVLGTVTLPDGSNVRRAVADTMHRLQEKLLRDREDDTRSLFSILNIWDALLDRGSGQAVLDVRWRRFQQVKKILEDRLIGQKMHLRPVLVDRAKLQWERLLAAKKVTFTATHGRILSDLLTLATSQYSELRSQAQSRLFSALDQFSYSYQLILPTLASNLQVDTVCQHELFKGSLYVLLGPKQYPIGARHDWATLADLWPLLVRSQPSEKLSVIRLLDSFVDTVHKHFPTVSIRLVVPESCVLAAAKLWDEVPVPSRPPPGPSEVTTGLKMESELCCRNEKNYFRLLEALMDAIESGNLHWRHHAIATGLLRELVHPDVPYPERVVRYFLRTLLHEALDLRKIAIRAVVFILKQQKRAHPKLPVDPTTIASSRSKISVPGARADNEWVQYDSARRPLSEEEWDAQRYLHKPYHGYFCWPRMVQMYAPSSEQPALDRTPDEMSPAEKEVHEFFSSVENVDRLIYFLSLEDKKGSDKFNGYRFIMFKGLFRNHGDAFWKLFLPHLHRLVKDKHESNQRCAAEIIAGVIRGSKHWPYAKVASLWETLGPIIRSALSSVTVETVADWGVCFATASENRDPNRHHWLLELLMEDPLREEASFIECGRLYALQGVLNQQEWRVAELMSRLLNYFRPFLTHPFQNVRERLGSVLANIFDLDMEVCGGHASLSPRVAPFVQELLPRLATLQELQAGAGANGLEQATRLMKRTVIGDAERDEAARLLKTVCRWVCGSLARSPYAAREEYYPLLPLLCLMESAVDVDEELARTCQQTLGALAPALTLPRVMPSALAALEKVAGCASWSARTACLDFLQVMVFYNMSVVVSEEEWVQRVSTLVLELLQDTWLEVREKAAQVLGGLLHCGFLGSHPKLLTTFRRQARTALPSRGPPAPELLRLRHSGVLGLCAFINASPYDVPDFVPDVFLVLGQHLNDPQPIPATIRKTLGDFKRTHHANWSQHSLKFSEEELAVLDDLTIPPSYYA